MSVKLGGEVRYEVQAGAFEPDGLSPQARDLISVIGALVDTAAGSRPALLTVAFEVALD